MTDSPSDLAAQAGPPVEGLSYTEASRELDEIVHFFEQRVVDVDQLVGRLVRATSLIEELDKRLRQTRMQVEQLVPRLAAVLSEGPPSAGDEEEDGGYLGNEGDAATEYDDEGDAAYDDEGDAAYDDEGDAAYDDEGDGAYDDETDEDVDDEIDEGDEHAADDADDDDDADDGSTPGLF